MIINNIPQKRAREIEKPKRFLISLGSKEVLTEKVERIIKVSL